ncbi:carboxypeptidase Y-deficient [Tulasnella sp. 331]|nr:carboxypeptidase Y-deficient [Tulasnella sp. 331]
MNPIQSSPVPALNVGYSTYKSKRTSSATIIPTEQAGFLESLDSEQFINSASKYLDTSGLSKLANNTIGSAFPFGSPSSTRSITTPPTNSTSSHNNFSGESPWQSPSTRATSPTVDIKRPQSVSPIPPISSPPSHIPAAGTNTAPSSAASTASQSSASSDQHIPSSEDQNIGRKNYNVIGDADLNLGETTDMGDQTPTAEEKVSVTMPMAESSMAGSSAPSKPLTATRGSTFRHIPPRSSRPVVSSPLRPSSSTRSISGVSRSSLKIPSTLSSATIRVQSPSSKSSSRPQSLHPPSTTRTPSQLSSTPSTSNASPNASPDVSTYVTPLASPGTEVPPSISEPGGIIASANAVAHAPAPRGSTPARSNGLSPTPGSAPSSGPTPSDMSSPIATTVNVRTLNTEKSLPSTLSTPMNPPTSSRTPGSSASIPSNSPITQSDTPPKPVQAPYRPGFQPKGAYASRTDDFLAARSSRVDSRKPEEKRSLRRLEKLVDLHFSSESTVKEKAPPARRSSSFFDLADLKGKGAADLWKGVVESTGNRNEKYIRDMEQNITHWEDDKDVSACPICLQSFHPLTNRKHHCRLCGRVVCSLPARQPIRPRTCSLLIVANPRTGKIDEVLDAIAYGVTRKDSANSGAATKGAAVTKDGHSRGVRICRDCNAVVQRQQFSLESAYVPPYARLYRTMIRVEQQIESSLPSFQEMIIAAESVDSKAQHAAASARKELLEMFAEYDAISKRVRALPCATGGSQDRLQAAITTRANLFLQQHMLPLKSLAAFSQKQKHCQTSSQSSSATASSNNDPTTPNGHSSGRYQNALDAIPLMDSDSALALSLQPLLEQEALLESYVEDAMQARKFEDAKTIKMNLNEIRVEIDKIARGGKVLS